MLKYHPKNINVFSPSVLQFFFLLNAHKVVETSMYLLFLFPRKEQFFPIVDVAMPLRTIIQILSLTEQFI
jgi:hypothetical protein